MGGSVPNGPDGVILAEIDIYLKAADRMKKSKY
jgi:hypothetical protein